MKLRWSLLAAAVSLVLAVLLSACNDASQSEEPPSTPSQPAAQATATHTATPAPTSVPTPTATPPFIMPSPDPRFAIPDGTPAPTATPTPEPSRSPLIGYAQQCGLLIFQLDSGQIVDDPALYTWHVLAQDIDQLVDELGQLAPPPELAEYHTANLDAWTSLRDAAKEHPSEDSFANDLETFFEELVDELLRVGSAPTITDEERELLFEEALVEKLRDFYGHNTYSVDQTAQEALKALPEEARKILAGIECVPPLFVVVAETDDVERSALAALYIATDGPNWNDNTNWLSDAPLRNWHGVTIGADGRVTYLMLTYNQLLGEIPEQLSTLSSLRLLDLGHNRLNGEIPPELASLSSLRTLVLRDNKLSGGIPPEITNLSELEILLLGGNMLSGEIPPEIGNLSELELLNLSGNMLSGEIPPEIANLTNLVNLDLGSNELTGEIPPWIGNLSNLDQLNLGGNQLSGQIPPEIGNLTGLTDLRLGPNQLSGDVPPELGNLVNLRYLQPFGNQLTGCYPENLRDALRNISAARTSGLIFCA